MILTNISDRGSPAAVWTLVFAAFPSTKWSVLLGLGGLDYRSSVSSVLRDSLAVIEPHIPGEGIWPENGVTQENCGCLGPTSVGVWVGRSEEFPYRENHCEPGRHPEAFPRGQSMLVR